MPCTVIIQISLEKNNVKFIVVLFSILILPLNNLAGQFISSFNMEKEALPYPPIIKTAKNGNIVIAYMEVFDSMEVANYKFYTKGKRNAFGLHDQELFIIILDQNLKLLDTFHFFGKSINKPDFIITENSGKIYLAFNTYSDSLFIKSKIYINRPEQYKENFTMLFELNLNDSNVKLIKIVNSQYSERVFVRSDEIKIFLGLSHHFDAYVDSLIFPRLFNGLHELDILLLRIDLKDNKVEQSYHFTSYDMSYPIDFVFDTDYAVYLLTEHSDKYVFYLKDTIFTGRYGGSLFFKLSREGNIDWVKGANVRLQNLLYKSNEEIVVSGNFKNNFTFDSSYYSDGSQNTNSFNAILDKNGNINDIKLLKGTGDKTITKNLNSTFGDFISFGSYRDTIYEAQNDYMVSIGNLDDYIFNYDSQTKLIKSIYIKGDNVDQIVDVAKLNDSKYLILGYTFSDTLIILNDTLVNILKNKLYYTYELSDSLITFLSNPVRNSPSREIKLFPNPTKQYINLDLSSFIFDTALFVIFNTQGQKVYSKKLNKRKNILDILHIQDGNYFYSVNLDNRIIISGKLQKIKV